MDVERYLRASSLWLYVRDGLDEEMIAEGALTTEGLVERRDAPFGSLFHLRFVGQLDLQGSAKALAGQRQLAKREQSEFHAGVGRLARGGLLPRLVDGLFSLSASIVSFQPCSCSSGRSATVTVFISQG